MVQYNYYLFVVVVVVSSGRCSAVSATVASTVSSAVSSLAVSWAVSWAVCLAVGWAVGSGFGGFNGDGSILCAIGDDLILYAASYGVITTAFKECTLTLKTLLTST